MALKKRRLTARGLIKNRFKQIGKTSLVVIMAAATIFIANVFIDYLKEFKAKATTGNAHLFIEPAEFTLPSNLSVHLWATTDKQLGYAQVELAFDSQSINLAQEIVFDHPALIRVIKNSSMTEANSTGRIFFVVGIDPSTKDSAPIDTFSIATLKFNVLTPDLNKTTSLQIIPGNIQLVDMNAIPFLLTSQNSSITLNPSASPTPDPTPSPTSPDSTTTIDNTGPQITHESGQIRNRFWVNISAVDESGISDITISSEGKAVKQCIYESSCIYNFNPKFLPVSLDISATDNAPQPNTTIKQIEIQ